MEEFKKQAHKEFDEMDFSDFEKEEVIVRYTMLHTEKIKSFISYIIDKTVQTVALEIQSRMPSHDSVQEYLSLITNKSDINNNKE